MLTFLILTSILTVSLGGASLVNQGLIMSRTQRYSTKAYFISEAGIERALFDIRKKNFVLSSCTLNYYLNFGNSPASCQLASISFSLPSDPSSEYIVKYTNITSPYKFSSKGKYQNTNRTVEIEFQD